MGIVLYGEDDANDAFFMERAFAKLGRREALRIVPNGGIAVQYLEGAGKFADRSQYPDPSLLLLDVKMPEVSGLEALAAVRRRVAFAAIPVAMFTSSTQATDIAFCRAHGANAYLVKPSNAAGLAPLVEGLLRAIERFSVESPRLAIDGNLL